MRTQGRRRLDVALIGAGGLVLAGVSVISAFGFNTERIDQMWVGATLQSDGTAVIREVIDDNFGNASDRHGLLRRIPGLTTQSPVAVHSPDGAPDSINSIVPFQFDDGSSGVEIRIGDATKIVSGRHRYVIDYSLGTIVEGSTIAWNAVGLGWELPIEDAEIHVVAPWLLTDVVCQQGKEGSTDPCEIDQVEPGHLVVHVSETIEPEHGVTVRATRGDDLAIVASMPDPPGLPDDPGAGLAQPAAVAMVAAIGGGLSMSRWVRRAGRERIGVGGATDAAFADGSSSTSERRVDATKLGDFATTDFAPPEGISAPMGGVILTENVQQQHKVAWLIEAAIEGAVDLVEEDGKTVRIDRLAPGKPATQEVLDTMFRGRETITLGAYEATFAKGWAEVGTQLEATANDAGLWDPAGDSRRLRVRVLGFIVMVIASVAVGFGAALAGRYGNHWGLLAGAAIVAGAGWAAVLRGWELRVRTPRGSALWLRVESFRRFLHDSEAFHAEEAAKRGVLREYTAWAVAVGEIDRWKRAVESSTVIPTTAGLGYVAMAPMLSSSTSSTATAPSSSGGGGGGGGGVGGGGGGGGGGNW
jgi:hypothetical protein